MGYKKGETNYYVYLHRNKTTGKVFYVGKGKCRRAWECANRSAFWSKTVRKYGHTIEIVLDNLQEWYAFELESELILKYGRRDNNTGCLVNLTDGGEGESGKVYTYEQRKRMSDARRGELSHNFDRTIYKYYNVFSGERLECLSSEFTKLTGCQHKRTRVYHYKGWTDPDLCTEHFLDEVISKNEGIHPLRFSTVLHNFVEIDTLMLKPMTVSQFYILTGKNPSNLLNKNLKDIRTLAGYTTKELVEKYTIEKIRAKSKSVVVYNFSNVLTNLTCKGTAEYISGRIGISVGNIYRLVKSNGTTVDGWRLTSVKDIPPSLVTSEFVHKDGRYFKGTRAAFKTKYNLDPAQLFRSNNKSGAYRGWSLLK